MLEPTPEHPDWSEERLRFKVLRHVYEHAGGACTRAVDCSETGADLGLRYEDLFRTLYYLESHHFLFRINYASTYCITPKGTRYIETAAGRRRSIRSGAHD